MKTKHDKELLDSMHDNPNNWKGFIYVNKNDNRLIVPKKIPLMGWTLNFSSPYAYILLISIVLIIIVFAFLI